jgi:hypothetical protein
VRALPSGMVEEAELGLGLGFGVVVGGLSIVLRPYKRRGWGEVRAAR